MTVSLPTTGRPSRPLATAANAIGGYFELERPSPRQFDWFPDAARLQSGRGCLRYLIQHYKPRSVRLPFFTCDALLQPFAEAGVHVEWYGLDDFLEPLPDSSAHPDVPFVYINYFGIKDRAAVQIGEHYNVWLDNTQAFFARPPSPATIAFNSARKVFGVPDGAFLFGVSHDAAQVTELPQNERFWCEHLLLRAFHTPEAGLPYFQRNEEDCEQGCFRMSAVTESILRTVDCSHVRQRRIANFKTLHRELSNLNRFPEALLDAGSESVPFCYPLLASRRVERRLLAERRLFVPTFWKECLTREVSGFEREKEFAANILPLPIDHRYDHTDMKRAAEIVRAIL